MTNKWKSVLIVMLTAQITVLMLGIMWLYYPYITDGPCNNQMHGFIVGRRGFVVTSAMGECVKIPDSLEEFEG